MKFLKPVTIQYLLAPTVRRFLERTINVKTLPTMPKTQIVGATTVLVKKILASNGSSPFSIAGFIEMHACPALPFVVLNNSPDDLQASGLEWNEWVLFTISSLWFSTSCAHAFPALVSLEKNSKQCNGSVADNTSSWAIKSKLIFLKNLDVLLFNEEIHYSNSFTTFRNVVKLVIMACYHSIRSLNKNTVYRPACTLCTLYSVQCISSAELLNAIEYNLQSKRMQLTLIQLLLKTCYSLISNVTYL